MTYRRLTDMKCMFTSTDYQGIANQKTMRYHFIPMGTVDFKKPRNN